MCSYTCDAYTKQGMKSKKDQASFQQCQALVLKISVCMNISLSPPPPSQFYFFVVQKLSTGKNLPLFQCTRIYYH